MMYMQLFHFVYVAMTGVVCLSLWLLTVHISILYFKFCCTSVIARMTAEDAACSVILTTHSMEEAEALCSRIGVSKCLKFPHVYFGVLLWMKRDASQDCLFLT